MDAELLATGRMAAAAEARLREARAAADAARSAAAASDRRAFEVLPDLARAARRTTSSAVKPSPGPLASV